MKTYVKRSIHMPTELAAQIQEVADKQERSWNWMVVYMMKQAFRTAEAQKNSLQRYGRLWKSKAEIAEAELATKKMSEQMNLIDLERYRLRVGQLEAELAARENTTGTVKESMNFYADKCKRLEAELRDSKDNEYTAAYMSEAAETIKEFAEDARTAKAELAALKQTVKDGEPDGDIWWAPIYAPDRNEVHNEDFIAIGRLYDNPARAKAENPGALEYAAVHTSRLPRTESQREELVKNAEPKGEQK